MAQSVFSSITVFGVHPDVPVRAFFMPKAKQTAHVSAHSTVHNISSIRQNGPYRQNFMRHPLSISWCTLTAYHFLSNTGNFLVCSRSFWLPLLQRKKEPFGSFFLWANRECSIKKMSVKGYLSSMHKISTAFCAWSWFSASS